MLRFLTKGLALTRYPKRDMVVGGHFVLKGFQCLTCPSVRRATQLKSELLHMQLFELLP